MKFPVVAPQDFVPPEITHRDLVHALRKRIELGDVVDLLQALSDADLITLSNAATKERMRRINQNLTPRSEKKH